MALSFFKRPKQTIQDEKALKLFNTETKQLEVFQALKPPVVTMYSCGPTVYDYAHIGNLRAYVFVDIVKRTLEYNGYEVKNTINFTDFGHLTDDADAGEDKMLKGLRREGLPITLQAMRNLSDIYIAAFKKDMAKLRIKEPTTWSRASDYIHQQIQLIKTLEEKGYTYETSDGVYFDISRFPDYGRLGDIDIHSLKDGARVEVNPEKRHPADFAIWKKGLLGWNSRWGKGFPGWHIECSAMALSTLGREIDIHTGGIDHIHTHHNAEIAQSEAATKRKFVHYWLHNAHLNIDGGKISKSLGNSIYLHNLEDRGYSADDFRYLLLTSHYRSNVNFSFAALDAAKHALYRLKRFIYEDYNNIATRVNSYYAEQFQQQLNNDFNTPRIIALAWAVTKDPDLTNGERCATLKHFDKVLAIGLSEDKYDGLQKLGVVTETELPEAVKKLVAEREIARQNKNWDESDRLRVEINLLGYRLKDTPEGPVVSAA